MYNKPFSLLLMKYISKSFSQTASTLGISILEFITSNWFNLIGLCVFGFITYVCLKDIKITTKTIK